MNRKFVDYLTLSARRGGFTTLLACLALSTATAGRATPEWQPVEEIAATAERYLLDNRIGPTSAGTRVKAGALDVRLKLPYCDKPLEGFLRRGAKTTARMIVGVRCRGMRQWKVYVPVDVIEITTVYVARRALPRGHVLDADDIVAQERDVSRLRSAYITEPSFLIGQTLKSPLITGKIITASELAVDNYIKRGQTVTLVSSSSGVRISMAGKALADATLNQRVRVKNLNSGRIVEGIVRSREHVEVLAAGQAPFFNARPKVSRPVADTGLASNDR